MDKNCFYYVESAPQVISAFRHYLQMKPLRFAMIVRLNGRKHNDEQIDNVIRELGIAKLGKLICCRAGSKLYANLVKEVFFQKHDKVCVGDIRSLLSLTAIGLANRKSEFVLLDDGVASISYYRRRAEGLRSMGRPIVKALERVLSFKLNAITLHTLLPLNSMAGMTIEINNIDLQSLFGSARSRPDPETAIFIGSKVVESGLCSIEYFNSVLDKFMAEFRGRNLFYVLHRDEDVEKLAAFAGITPLRLDLPLELEFGLKRSIPGAVCGFYSAGLVNFLPYRDQVKLIAYGLPLDESNSTFHQSIRAGRYLFDQVLRIHSAA